MRNAAWLQLFSSTCQNPSGFSIYNEQMEHTDKEATHSGSLVEHMGLDSRLTLGQGRL